MPYLTRYTSRLRSTPAYKPALESLLSDIQAAVRVIDTVAKSLASLRSGLVEIETEAMYAHESKAPFPERHDLNWITRHEAAVLANVDPTTINNWVRSGIVPKSALLPIGKKRVRYSREWFETHRVGTADTSSGLIGRKGKANKPSLTLHRGHSDHEQKTTAHAAAPANAV